MYKKLFDKYGSIKVYLVDEEEVRNISPELEEFTNYAIYSDLPQIVKTNEIWISQHVDSSEYFYLINEALARIKYEDSGMSVQKAYNKALEFDKASREKSLHHTHIVPHKDKKIDSKVYIKKINTVNDIDIWVVDGKLIRDLYHTDFVEGGHDYVYSWIPHNQIFIDREVVEKERPLIILHELIERNLMKDKMSYEKAHKKAAKIEWRARHGRNRRIWRT